MLHTIRHLHGKEVHAAHRERQEEERGRTVKPSTSMSLKIQDTTNNRNYLTAVSVLLLQQRWHNDKTDGKVERKEGKAKQSSEGHVTEDQAQDGMSQRSRALFTQQRDFFFFFTQTNFRLKGAAL